jgi:hypothetical protein
MEWETVIKLREAKKSAAEFAARAATPSPNEVAVAVCVQGEALEMGFESFQLLFGAMEVALKRVGIKYPRREATTGAAYGGAAQAQRAQRQRSAQQQQAQRAPDAATASNTKRPHVPSRPRSQCAASSTS